MNAQGSATTLMLRHELRLQWRTNSNKARAGLIAALVLAVLHLVAVPIAFSIPYWPTPPRAELLIGTSAVLLFALLAMTSMGLVAVVKAIYDRHDLDLLLSSPIEPRAIVLTRIAAIALQLGASSLLFAPFANVFALFGYPKFLLLYPATVCLTLAATGLSLVLAQGLFRLVGARRTRLFAQIAAGLIALVFAVLAQIPNLLPKSTAETAIHALGQLVTYLPDTQSAAWLPARAALGEPLALIGAVVLSLALFAAAALTLADRFLANAGAATVAASAPAKARRAAARPFGGGVASVMRRKEWRLIARDPWLLTQIVQQMVFILPLAFLMWKGSTVQMPATWLVIVLLAGSLAGNLAWLAISGEDAPDLIASAPVPPRAAARAKLEAALAPVGILLAPPIAFAAYLNPWLGLTLAVCCAGSAASCALLEFLRPTPGKRGSFNERGQQRPWAVLAQMSIAALWALIGLLMLFHPLGIVLPLLIAATVAAILIAG